MITRISTLPDDCIQLIFDRIPTRQLLQNVRRVSRVWQRHQQLNCRVRKCLIIIQGEKREQGYINQLYNRPFVEHNIDQNGNSKNQKFFIEYNRILISTSKCAKVKFLVSTFPNVHTLILSTDRTVSQYLQSFSRLIAHYSPKLITLKLYYEGEIKSKAQETSLTKVIGNLFNQLNLLVSLRHLTFHIDDQSLKFRINPHQIEEPLFLTRVTEFYMDFECLEIVMLECLRKYEKAGRLDQLERLYLTADSISSEKFEQVPLVNRYSFVPFEKYLYNEQYMKRMVTKFTSLITINYTLSERSIKSLTKLTSILFPLTKLVHIRLKIEVLPSNKISLHPNSNTELAFVKALDVHFGGDYLKLLPPFCQTQVSTIVRCFPNLQSIRIAADGDAFYDDDFDDYYDEDDEDDDDAQELEDYANQFFVNLKTAYKRPSLRTEFCGKFYMIVNIQLITDL